MLCAVTQDEFGSTVAAALALQAEAAKAAVAAEDQEEEMQGVRGSRTVSAIAEAEAPGETQ